MMIKPTSPTPPPLHEKEEVEKSEKHEEGIACDDEPKVKAFEELEKGWKKLKIRVLRK